MSPEKRAWLSTWRSRSLLALLALLTLLAAVGVIVWAALSNEVASRRVVELSIPRLNALIPGEIHYSSFEGTIGSRIVLEDLEVLDDRGEVCVRAKRVEIDWDVWDLATFDVDVSRMRLVDPDVLIALREDGSVNLVSAFVVPQELSSELREPSPWTLDLRNLALDGGKLVLRRGSVEQPADLELTNLQLAGNYHLSGGAQRFAIEGLASSIRHPIELDGVELSGALELAAGELRSDALDLSWRNSRLTISGAVQPLNKPHFDLALAVQSLALADLKQWAPKAPLQGELRGSLQLSGPVTAPELRGRLSAQQGHIDIQRAALVTGSSPTSHELQLELLELPLASLLVTEVDLPPRLSLEAQWSGTGMGSEDLRGQLQFSAKPFAIAGLRPEVVDAQLQLMGSDVQAQRVVLNVAGGRISATGNASLGTGRFAADLQGSFARLGQLASLTGLEVRGQKLELGAEVRGSWAADSKVPLTSRGEASIEALEYASLSVARATAGWELKLGAFDGSVPELHGSVQLEAADTSFGTGQFRRASMDASITGMEADYSLRASNGDEFLFQSDGQLDWSRLPSFSLRSQRTEMLAGEFLLQGAEPFSLHIRSGTYQLERLRLLSGDASATVQGSYDSGSSKLRLTSRVRGLDLSSLNSPLASLELADGVPLRLGLDGELRDLLIKVKGSLAEPKLQLSTELVGFEVDGRGPVDLSASLRSEDGLVSGEASLGDLASLAMKKLPVRLRLDGRGQAVELDPEGHWDLEVQLARSSVEDLLPLLGRPLPEQLAAGSLRGGFSLAGSTEDLQLRVDLGLSDLEVSGQRLHGQLGLAIEDGRLRIEDTLLKTATVGRVLKLEGAAAAPLGPYLLQKLGPARYRQGEPLQVLADMELRAGIRKLPMSLVHLLVPGLEPLTGALQAELDLTGQLDDPQGRLDARLLGGRVGRQELKEFSLEASLAAAKFNAELAVQAKAGGTLSASAQCSMPAALGASREQVLGVPDLQVNVVGDGFPLAVVSAFIPGTTDSSGQLRIDGVVAGSLLHPEPQVALEMAGGKFCHEGTSVCYQDVLLDGRLETGRLTLQELSFQTIPQVRNPLDLVRSARSTREDARFRLDGFVLMDGLRPKWTELDLELEQAWASYTEEVKVQVDGGLKVRGYYPALKLAGEVELQNVRVELGRSATRRKVQPLDLPAKLRIHRIGHGLGAGGPADAEQEEPPSLLDTLMTHSEANITLKLGNNVRAALAVGIAGQRSEAVQALNLLGSIEPDLVLVGDVSLGHKMRETSLVGSITLGRGSRLKVLTRDFEVDEGSVIEFVGKIPDSQLNLRATYSSRYGPVTVVVTERMAAPSIRFESEVFEDQADILSVLVTGKPISELSTAEGSQALSGIAGALAGFGTKAFGRYTPFDSLVVVLGDDLSSGSAEAGKALGPRVFLVTRFRWGTEEGENRIEGQLEVQLNPRLYLETRIGDRLQGAAQLVWKRQF